MFIAKQLTSFVFLGFLSIGTKAASLQQSSLVKGDALNSAIPTLSSALSNEHDLALLKRETSEMRRELQAVMEYNCPHGGTVRRNFRWIGIYTLPNEVFKIRAVYNIDKIGDIVVNDDTQEFSSFWEHSYCIEGINYRCSYHIRAHTFGRIGFRGISMFMTAASTNADENPTVHEHCVIFGPHEAPTCPSIVEPTGIHLCAIDRISVTTVV